MTERLSLDAATSALLVMDYQSAVVDMVPDGKAGLVERAARLVGAARAVGVRVIHVVVGFRPGYPEVSPRNVGFAALRGSDRFAQGAPGTAIHPGVAPRPDEVVVTKHRVSAFAGTDLEMVLRAAGVETLVLAGIATSGVVLSTLRHAADADYRLVVVEDACADRDPDVHAVLTQKVFPRQAAVVRVHDAVAALEGAPRGS